MNMLFEPELETPKIQFRIVGHVACPEFQICRCYAERLYRSFPNDYKQPETQPLLDVDWHIFLNKLKRRVGGEKVWALEKTVAVFKDGEFLGDDKDLLAFVATRYKLTISNDYEKIGMVKLMEYITKQTDLGLYSDLVPQTCHLFLRRCIKRHDGYTGTSIQRIVLPSWIQCGGWNLKHVNIPCENYVIPHDKRGVVSMCHNGKHTDNSTQFFITLDSTPWMNYKYVAFGQLMQGEEILRTIEKVPTHYEAPTKKIDIIRCGEYTLHPEPDRKAEAKLEKFLTTKAEGVPHLHEDVIDLRDAESVMSCGRHKWDFYCHRMDLQSHMPISFSDNLISRPTDQVDEEEEQYCGNFDCNCRF